MIFLGPCLRPSQGSRSVGFSWFNYLLWLTHRSHGSLHVSPFGGMQFSPRGCRYLTIKKLGPKVHNTCVNIYTYIYMFICIYTYMSYFAYGVFKPRFLDKVPGTSRSGRPKLATYLNVVIGCATHPTNPVDGLDNELIT